MAFRGKKGLGVGLWLEAIPACPIDLATEEGREIIGLGLGRLGARLYGREQTGIVIPGRSTQPPAQLGWGARVETANGAATRTREEAPPFIPS